MEPEPTYIISNRGEPKNYYGKDQQQLPSLSQNLGDMRHDGIDEQANEINSKEEELMRKAKSLELEM
jgi:hypothetical protein